MAEIKCARCARPLPDEKRRVYSAWSKHHYCTDVDACTKRTASRYRTDSIYRLRVETERAERVRRIDKAHELLAAASSKKRGR